MGTKLLKDLQDRSAKKRRLVIAQLLVPRCYLVVTCAHLLFIHEANMSMKKCLCHYVFPPSLYLVSLCWCQMPGDMDEWRKRRQKEGRHIARHCSWLNLYIFSNIGNLITLCTSTVATGNWSFSLGRATVTLNALTPSSPCVSVSLPQAQCLSAFSWCLLRLSCVPFGW